MAIEQKDTTINGVTYQVTQMDAVTALVKQVQLIKILGPSLPSLAVKFIQAGSKEKLMALLKSGGAIDIATELFKNIDDRFTSAFILSLFDMGVHVKKSNVNGPYLEKVEFTPYFDGNLADAWKLVPFILEANFNLGELLTSSGNTSENQEVVEEQKI